MTRKSLDIDTPESHLSVMFIRPAAVAAIASLAVFSPALAETTRLSDYIRPFVGTKGEGNTYPGPSAPFGMIQISPDTEDELWETASGYEYSDPTIMGFSLTHLSGTGIPDLGDFLFMPQVGAVLLEPGREKTPDAGYRSRFSHDAEEASAGYYKVKLADNDVTVELAAAERAGMLRITFPASDESSILTDLSHALSGGRWKVVWSHLRVEDDSTITGFRLVNGWARERPIYFAARYSRPFDRAQIFSEGKEVKYDGYRFRSEREAAGPNLQFVAHYKTKTSEPITIKVAVSGVSATNALENLDAEIPDWDFEKVVEDTRAKWDASLANLQMDGTQEEKETFYTALYHALLAPNVYQDVNGEYRGLDQEIHIAKGFTNYTVFSLWDTYRATHPLLALIEPKRDADMILSMLAHYDQSVEKLLPIWSFHGNETWCMIGYHAIPVIADAFLKGVPGFDAERAYEAMRNTATNPNYDSVTEYATLGWVPFDKENESVSKTLEYAYDDWCIAQMAKALGKQDDYELFMKRAGAFRNVFDKETGLMRGRDSQGNWRTPFDPHEYAEDLSLRDFTEGTSWQYSWYVPHDVPGLIELMGGREKFLEKLDLLFTLRDADKNSDMEDVQGRIGQYWHGNEPSHHIIYLYSMAGQPWRAAELLHEVVSTQYGNQPGSLSGNDDCGQMSAWYLFTCLGFYPVAPADDRYVIGAPQVKEATMKLGNGKTFIMTANNLSTENIYVQSVEVNGQPLEEPYLPFAAVKDGGTLVFTMGPKPSKWGTAD